MKIAIMQPYIFPYIGYFQLVKAVDKFVFYDDVNFIKKSWINRNRILLNEAPFTFSIPLVKASQNKRINDTKVVCNEEWSCKLLKTINSAYAKAPNFDEVYTLIETVLKQDRSSIGNLAAESVSLISEFLEIDTEFCFSSSRYDNEGLGRADRLIDISLRESCSTYINAIGGTELYEKQFFKDKGVDLYFLRPFLRRYQQFGGEFVPGLSIIDVLMFNLANSA